MIHFLKRNHLDHKEFSFSFFFKDNCALPSFKWTNALCVYWFWVCSGHVDKVNRPYQIIISNGVF